MLDLSVINAMFPPDLPEPADWERRFGPRALPEGAEVTRFAPSPTGHLHIGGLYTAAVARAVAHQSGGVHLLRVEDTDRSRQVAWAAEGFTRLLGAFGLAPDEGGVAGDGAWGPYLQSERRDVYLSHVRELVRRDRAYPCFCAKDRLARSAEEQRAGRSPLGYYGRWAPCRTLAPEEAARRLAAGEPYVVRFRCPYEFPGRVRFTDRIRSSVTMRDNGNDIVLLKSSSEELPLPTYHFAHVVDDRLMRVSLVVRGEEWLSSTPVHLQLHTALGWEPPAYAHLAPLMKAEGPSRRKLSKRKDPEASVDYYLAAGYPPAAVQHYLRGLANIRLMDVPTAEALAAPVRLDGMRPSGPLLDLPKLHSLSREFIASLPPDEVYAQLLAWARDHDPELASVLTRHRGLALAAVAAGRPEGAPVRKDLDRWSCFRDRYGFFFAELFGAPPAPGDDRYGGLPDHRVRAVAAGFAGQAAGAGTAEEWYGRLRDLASRHGFAPDTAAWRRDPGRWAGPPSVVANVVRVALTGATRSPDLFTVVGALGPEEVLRRLTAVAG
ncbi:MULTISPECIES: glutamate--tRNA ligase family protein [unclassified Streptomyces]|uniref:glutamate--tRNA ligase n=1 Tax=unclassified Streptomyces TaxID=2593676 RepID=UPI000700665A|nr:MULTISPECIES: glutamate--tRNA ligase family protein [unclassified Streptomyces]KQX56144.1 glutamate--tRNA ligase [Streptomyces sp. Root1304]KRA96960.1 glutamate--tRNA ligase [Streptomyces sp. Root66D1]